VVTEKKRKIDFPCLPGTIIFLEAGKVQKFRPLVFHWHLKTDVENIFHCLFCTK
jgi:hypothetical protein